MRDPWFVWDRWWVGRCPRGRFVTAIHGFAPPGGQAGPPWRSVTGELLNPVVQPLGDAAVLTFNYVSWGSEGEARWNCTEVYRHDAVGWRIVQTHWSYTNAGTPTRAAPVA